MSQESLILFKLILNVFKATPSIQVLQTKVSPEINESSLQSFVEYSVQVLNNLGNYKSFGDTKFIPRLPVEEFHTILKKLATDQSQLQAFECVKYAIYSV